MFECKNKVVSLQSQSVRIAKTYLKNEALYSTCERKCEKLLLICKDSDNGSRL